MQFKKGYNWKACYDEERGLYTAQYGQYGGYTLYEITKEIFDRLEDAVTTELDACRLLDSGRRLYKSVDDRCGPPYSPEELLRASEHRPAWTGRILMTCY